jgi:hypothetical protein
LIFYDYGDFLCSQDVNPKKFIDSLLGVLMYPKKDLMILSNNCSVPHAIAILKQHPLCTNFKFEIEELAKPRKSFSTIGELFDWLPTWLDQELYFPKVKKYENGFFLISRS